MEKLRVAIVGCGGIANQKHMPSLKANADKANIERTKYTLKLSDFGGINRLISFNKKLK